MALSLVGGLSRCYPRTRIPEPWRLWRRSHPISQLGYRDGEYQERLFPPLTKQDSESYRRESLRLPNSTEGKYLCCLGGWSSLTCSMTTPPKLWPMKINGRYFVSSSCYFLKICANNLWLERVITFLRLLSRAVSSCSAHKERLCFGALSSHWDS